MFHEALYGVLSGPESDAVDIYQVIGTPSNKPYRLFHDEYPFEVVEPEPDSDPSPQPDPDD